MFLFSIQRAEKDCFLQMLFYKTNFLIFKGLF